MEQHPIRQSVPSPAWPTHLFSCLMAAVAGAAALGETQDATEEWAQVRGFLLSIQGVATEPIRSVVSDKYTDGMLMGNGDVGVFAGGTLTNQRFGFSKGDFIGSYDDSLYVLGSMARPGKTAPSMWGLWLASEKGRPLKILNPWAGSTAEVLDISDGSRAPVAFDGERLADQIKLTGASYHLLTIGQGTTHLLTPSALFDELFVQGPSNCLRRDLVSDMAAALAKRGIFGTPFKYTYPSRSGSGYDLVSAGPDREFGTGDDILRH